MCPMLLSLCLTFPALPNKETNAIIWSSKCDGCAFVEVKQIADLACLFLTSFIFNNQRSINYQFHLMVGVSIGQRFPFFQTKQAAGDRFFGIFRNNNINQECRNVPVSIGGIS